jgi:hypothetical protein
MIRPARVTSVEYLGGRVLRAAFFDGLVCELDFAGSLPGALSAVDGHDICRVQVNPSGFPVDATVIKQKPGGPKTTVTEFYVRQLNGTVALDVVEKQKYINQRWPSTPADRS